MRILTTGGSGFIGTSIVLWAARSAYSACLSIDRRPPQAEYCTSVYRCIDILCERQLNEVVQEFKPTAVIHSAARTDLDGKAAGDYAANTKGIENLIEALSRQPSVQRCVFLSSKLVCRNGYRPNHDQDCCPDTLYGESKVVGEQIVRTSPHLKCTWCIARPSSIWGPWFGIPYKGFFLSIARKRYFHPGAIDPPKSFGFVGNVVFQIRKLLEAPAEQIHRQTFYLSDYDEFTIRQWANTISRKLHGRPVRTIPTPIMRLLAKAGDAMKVCGYRNPPITSFRLRNMWQDTTGIPLDNIKAITGPLPYTMEQGVDLTIDWLRQTGQIR